MPRTQRYYPAESHLTTRVQHQLRFIRFVSPFDSPNSIRRVIFLSDGYLVESTVILMNVQQTAAMPICFVSYSLCPGNLADTGKYL